MESADFAHDLKSEVDHPVPLVQELLLHPVPPRQLTGRALACGVPIDRPVIAFRARPLKRPAGALEHVLRRQAAHNWITVLVLDGDVVGLTTGAPRLGTSQAVVGLGPPVMLAAAHRSFVFASRALDAAWATGARGCQRLEDVALAAMAAADVEVAEALEQAYFTGLDTASGTTGKLLEETVHVYLDCDLHAGEAAALLGMHPNGLRYRIRRFEELTGTNLQSLEDAFRIKVALEWRRRRALGTRSDDWPT